MERYRYRTAVLVGPWRATPAEAIADAIQAGQAVGNTRDGLSWRVDGAIEQEAGATRDDAD